jgi:hypothetical protein
MESSAASSAPPPGFAADVLANVLARMRPENSDGGISIAVALSAIGALAILVVVAIALVIPRGKPADETEANNAATAPKMIPVKAEARPPTFPSPVPPPTQPVAAQKMAASAPVAASVRAWTIRASTGPGPAVAAASGQQSGAVLWPEVWQLPGLASTVNGKLTSLRDPEAAPKLSLNVAAADFVPPTTIAVVPEMEPTGRLPAGVSDPLATLRLEGGDLLFSWALQSDTRLASQLMNCLLEISDGGRKRVAQFRDPVVAEPIAVDWTAEKQSIELVVPHSPRNSKLQLEITNLSGFSSEARLRNGSRATAPAGPAPPPAAPGMAANAGFAPGFPPGMGMSAFVSLPGMGKLTIEFPELPGLEIQVGFKEERGKIAISVDPTLRDESKEGELSLRRIAQIEDEARKQIPSAQRDLESAERSLKLWSEKLKDRKANEPPSTSRRFIEWKMAHTEATMNVARFERGVADLSARIEKAKARLELATNLRAMLKDSTTQATIHYVIYSECGEPDLLLVDGQGP